MGLRLQNRVSLWYIVSIIKSVFSISLIASVTSKPTNISEKSLLIVSTEKIETLPDSEEVMLRSVITDKAKMWPNAVVPYEVYDGFDDYSKLKIQKAIKLYHKISCVRFKRRTNEKNYIKFMPAEKGCSSYVGMTGGKQEIWLMNNCFKLAFYKGAVVHEMLHALGFIHEQMRDDRECYVAITGIGKTLRDLAIVFNTDTSWIYDHRSLMHYKEREYLKGRRGERLGNYRGTLTHWDRMKLNSLYCKGPHYCDSYPYQCNENERNERFCRANMP